MSGEGRQSSFHSTALSVRLPSKVVLSFHGTVREASIRTTTTTIYIYTYIYIYISMFVFIELYHDVLIRLLSLPGSCALLVALIFKTRIVTVQSVLILLQVLGKSGHRFKKGDLAIQHPSSLGTSILYIYITT
jgi:hypothetical protein